MAKRAPLPDELVGRSFTLRSALSADLSISRTRAKDLTTPSREVRVPVGAIHPVLSRCRPYVELLPGSFVSHTTAAEIHGIHLPHWISHEQVHLSRGRQTAGPRRKGVKGHRLDISEGDVVEIDGLPVTSLAEPGWIWQRCYRSRTWWLPATRSSANTPAPSARQGSQWSRNGTWSGSSQHTDGAGAYRGRGQLLIGFASASTRHRRV